MASYHDRVTDASNLFESVVLRLGVVGARWEERYARSLEPEGIKPKHVALLAVIRAGVVGSQVEVAARMRIAPPLVVGLADDLEKMDAIARTRDPADRRRQLISLTPTGERLLGRANSILAKLDEEVSHELGDKLDSLRTALDMLAKAEGLPDRDAGPDS